MSRRRLSTILLASLLLAAFAGLSAARFLLQGPGHDPNRPNRSSYHAGPEGTQAFYQWLGVNGYAVERWRKPYTALDKEMGPGLMIAIGLPPSGEFTPRREEARAMRDWLQRGGRLLLLGEQPVIPFNGATIQIISPAVGDPPETGPEGIRVAPGQPTHLTRGVRHLVTSRDATRILLSRPRLAAPLQPEQPLSGERGMAPYLESPVLHFEDDTGALLADFRSGKGRVLLVTDSSLFSNQGLPRGDNLRLARRLIQELTRAPEELAAGGPLPIFLDEYHHGYRSEQNELVAYFHGTPALWIVLQGLLLGTALLFVAGRRFGRPLTRPSPDRHSPHEFLDSMARLRQAAQARDLAIESIYPRFRQSLCRRLGCSVHTPNEELISRLNRQPFPVPPRILHQLILEAELVLGGQPIDDRHLLRLVQQLRITGQAFTSSRTSRGQTPVPSPFPGSKRGSRSNDG